MGEFLKNVWYIAGWSSEVVADRPLARTIAGTKVVFFRDAQGELAALQDRCPHRLVPLSRGKMVNGVLECAYHGLQFDRSGDCVANPHGPISRALCVASYQVAEKFGLLWLWLGDPSKAKLDAIPDMSAVKLEAVTIRGYLPVRAHHMLLVDNILDLSHGDYLHNADLGSRGATTRARTRYEENEDSVLAEWFTGKDPGGVAILRAELPDPTCLADMWTEVRWHTGGAVMLKTGMAPAGEPRERGVVAHVIHAMTPETAGSSHYFYSAWRNYRSEDAEYTRAMEQAVRYGFEVEDKPMIEAQQDALAGKEFMSSKPSLFGIDTASVRARRLYDRVLAAEASSQGMLSHAGS